MTSSEAIPLLRKLIAQIPELRHRPAYNADYRAWEKETVRILAEGFDLSYLTRFERFKPHRVRNVDNFEGYLKDLERKQRLLEEIVATHKSLLCGSPVEEDEGPRTILRADDLVELGVEPEHVEIKIQPAEPALSCDPAAVRAEKAREAAAPKLTEPAEPEEEPAEPEEEPMLAAEERLKAKILEKEQLLEFTQQAIAEYRRQLEALGRLKGLLAAEGDKLTGLVKDALNVLGLEVAAGDKQPGLFVREGGRLIPLEIESAKGEVPERALRRLIGRLPDDPPEGYAARGLLLGSAHMATPIQERLDSDAPYFGEALQDQARTFGICLLSLKDVFNTLAGESEQGRAEFKAAVLSTTGLFSPAEAEEEEAVKAA